MSIKKKIIICAISWILAGMISVLVLLDGALSHSEARKDRADKIIFSLMAANVCLNTFVALKKGTGKGSAPGRGQGKG